MSFAIKKPVQKLTGLVAGFSHGCASLRARRDWHAAVQTGKEAAARREADFEEEIEARPRTAAASALAAAAVALTAQPRP